MGNLLVVVDMINGFVTSGNLADKKINAIVPAIEHLIQSSIDNNALIVAFKDCHAVDDEEFKVFPEHCIRGTEECELIPALKKYEDQMFVIEKPTTNGFKTTLFKNLIINNHFDNVIVCGCCTDICVQNFCESLAKFFKNQNIKSNIVVFKDAVATFDSPGHPAIESQNKSLAYMKNLGIIIGSVYKNESSELNSYKD